MRGLAVQKEIMPCHDCSALIGQSSVVQPHDALHGETTVLRGSPAPSHFRCGTCGNVLVRPDTQRRSNKETPIWRLLLPVVRDAPSPACGGNFHHYRAKPARYTLYLRLWHWHDNHPLPPRLNRAAREVLYLGRKLKQVVTTARPKRGRDEYGDPVVPRDRYPHPVALFEPVPLAAIEARFREIHLANEHLYNGDGSWDPHPLMPLYGGGIPIEEISERIVGYLGAFEAFGNPVFLERAEEAGRHLLERRMFANGHLRLEAHLVVELEYTYAGCALLALWHQNRTRTEYLDAARKIADRLVEEHIGGAIDHALKPAQLLAPMYRLTGNETYLKAALRRAFRAVTLQLPYGGWPGQDSRIWYHCIIARSLIDTYIATPNTLAYYTKKDHIARAITAALNRIAFAQSEDGHIKVGRGDGSRDPFFGEQAEILRQHSVQFVNGRFLPAALALVDFAPHQPMDFLTTAFEELAVQPAATMAHGLAWVAVRTSALHRLEFETHFVGRYAQFLRRLARINSETGSRVGVTDGLDSETPLVQAHSGR